MVNVIVSPGAKDRIWVMRATASVTGAPLTSVMTSPALTPALAAGPSSTTLPTVAPLVDPSCTSRFTPITGVDALPVAMISSTMRFAVLLGIAKPRPIEPAVPLASTPNEAMAELTPTTSAAALTRGPPELPGLMAASVWMALM